MATINKLSEKTYYLVTVGYDHRIVEDDKLQNVASELTNYILKEECIECVEIADEIRKIPYGVLCDFGCGNVVKCKGLQEVVIPAIKEIYN